MPSPVLPDLARVPCPLCPGETSLEIALRLELEAESEVVFAACPACHRMYEVAPGGAMSLETGHRPGLRLFPVRCPQCLAAGYAVTYTVPELDAESYVLLTCRECHHTFQQEPDRGQESGHGGGITTQTPDPAEA